MPNLNDSSLNRNSAGGSVAKGIICIILSGLCFSLMSVAIRYAGDLPSMQKCVFRNAVALIIAAAYMIKNRIPVRCEKGNGFLMLLRSAFGTVGLVCNYYAVRPHEYRRRKSSEQAVPFRGARLRCDLP